MTKAAAYACAMFQRVPESDMKRMQGSKLTLASSHFASGLHQTASAKLYRTHFSATTTSA